MNAKTFAKHFWMASWRIFVILAILRIPWLLSLLIAVVLGAIGAYAVGAVFGVEIFAAPIIRAVMKKPLYKSADVSKSPSSSGNEAKADWFASPSHGSGDSNNTRQQRQSNTQTGNESRRYGNPDRDSSSESDGYRSSDNGRRRQNYSKNRGDYRPGTLTGYEPNELRKVQAPISFNAYGVAGLGLHDSEFSSQNVYSGQMGEVNFYKALCIENLIDSFTSFWSVGMPRADGSGIRDTAFESDVDCVIVQGSSMYLIDLKYYVAGDFTWHSSNGTMLHARDNKTGQDLGKTRKMSRNMAMADARFKTTFPNLDIESYVVLLPTNQGVANIAPGTVWPGNVPLITVNEMIERLSGNHPEFADPAVLGILESLLKD